MVSLQSEWQPTSRRQQAGRQDVGMPTTSWGPEQWPENQLRADAAFSLQALNDTQKDVTNRRATYAHNFDEACQLFHLLMENSNNLLELAGFSFASNKDLVSMGRFTGGPLISNDDLERIVGRTGLGNKRIDPELADDAAEVIKQLIDPRRFPWVDG